MLRNTFYILTGAVLILSVLLFSCANKNKAQTIRKVTIEPRATEHHSVVEHDEMVVSKEANVFRQPDGTSLTVLVIKTKGGVIYETVDGYTLLRNEEDVFEYAIKDEKSGKLKLSGEKSNEMSRRFKRESRFVEGLEKHLRSEK